MCCLYLCLECDNEPFTVATLDGNPLNISHCPHCGTGIKDLEEFRDEDDYYQWCADQGAV
jgi:hypothetical protein